MPFHRFVWEESSIKLKNTCLRRNLFSTVIFSYTVLLLALSVLAVTGCVGTGASRRDGPIIYSGTSDPEAIGNAKSLLKWLYTLPYKEGRRVLSGQEVRCYDAPQGYYDFVRGIERRTGKLPALIETDYYASTHENYFIDTDRKTEMLRKHWEMGGLVALHCNFPSPWTGSSIYDFEKNGGEYSDIYTPGTEVHRNMKEQIDLLAEELLKLQEHNVVVLLRPFHEVNGGWFWWFSEDPEDFKTMWRYRHTYLRKEREVHNLLWIYSPSPVRKELFRKQAPHLYYPGEAYVDINALDLYSDNLDDRYRRNYTEMINLGKPFGFGELGGNFPPTEENLSWSLMNIAKAAEKHYPEMVYWLSWSSFGKYGIMAMEQLPDLEELFAHPLIASMEDMDFPREPSPATGTSGKEAEKAPDKGQEEEKIKIGFIDCSPGHVLGTPDYFETAARAVAERFKDTVEIVPVRGLQVYRMGNAVTRLVEEEGCSVIFVDDNNDYEKYLVEAVKSYPEVTFVTPASNVFDTLPNVRTFGINSDGWYYLIGIAAGTVTKTGKIGYVAFSEAEWSIEHANEFALGVEEVNPEAEIFFTPSEGRNEAAARMLIDKGCDVFNGFVGWYEEIRVLEEAHKDGKVVCAFSNILPRDVSPGVIAAGLPENLGEVFSRILRGILTGDELPDPYWTDFRSGIIRIDSKDPPFIPRVRRVLQSAPAPAGAAGYSGGGSVYDFILERHRALAEGTFWLNLDRFTGFHPNVRRVPLPEAD